MPDRASFADVMQDSKQLKAACVEHAGLLGDVVAGELQTLDETIQKLEGLKVQSDSLKVARQSVSAEIFNVLLVLREVVMRLRAAAKLKIGPRSELLVQFGITPLRLRLQKPRSRKKKEEPTPPPPVETAAEAAKKHEAA